MQEKRCPKCETTKLIIAFSKDSYSKTGIRSYCKECCKSIRKKYYQKDRRKNIDRVVKWRKDNKEKALRREKRYRVKTKKKAIDGYGGICTCCSEAHIEFLTIEHKNMDGKKHRQSSGGSIGVYRNIIKRNFPEEYTVLCMNCNFAKRFGEICPHKQAKE